MFKELIVFVFSACAIPSLNFVVAQDKPIEKKLIEFGWDYPKVSQLKNNIRDMEKAPFDGVVFSLDFSIYNAFDTIQYADSKFQYGELSEIQWKKFTDNFLFVRGTSLSGARWLDDRSWVKISQNIKKISKALAVSKAKGIGFDPEYYYPDSTLNPWIYKPSLFNNLPYQEVGDYVRKRGEQFIKALQVYKPDVKILCFWLLGLVAEQSKNHPMSETGMALYPFFVEGMLAGKNDSSEIIDGNELSYWYKDPESFVKSGELQRENGSKLIDQSLQSKFKKVSFAQAIFFDGLFAKLPLYDKGFDKETRYRWFRNNLYFAFKTSDKYVWLYSQNLNWWKNKVDSGVLEAIIDVRNRIRLELNNNGVKATGRPLLFNFKKDNPGVYKGFTFSYSSAGNILKINVLKNDITDIDVFNNSQLIYSVSRPTKNILVDLRAYDGRGNLIIISRDPKISLLLLL